MSLGGDSGGEAASLREAPLPQPPSPEEWLGIGLCFSSDLCAHVSWGRFPVIWLRSRRLTEPPRPANVYLRFQFMSGGPKGWRGRSESCQTGSVHRLVSGGHETVACGGYAATPRRLLQHASSSFTWCCISSMYWSALSKEIFRGEVVFSSGWGILGMNPDRLSSERAFMSLRT